ncbi:biotin synthase BioB [Hippea maritima]|uniref:Biotin synthase n=1 Tax=Hippea maritima (strain ATCC 700847 / DSM 10411 / MH2) TaxID=760142 RepID=F2LTY4_HIPMA|nr:biotin synthase BioB [Hippea maritima]AEA33383.1 biotin synthase [Hippea maritima DSM 10411]
MINKLIEKAIKKESLSKDELFFLIKYPNLNEICKAALRIKNHFFKSIVEFCSIINAKSGKCSENCKFCAQSSHYRTNIKEYDFIEVKNIYEQAKKLKAKGVKRFSIVTSGKSPSKRDLEKLEEAIKIVKKLNLLPDVSIGIVDRETLLRLKKAGLEGLHHNLETAESFFKNICTTHDYKEDIESIKTAVDIGLYVCSGGIFGVGENWEHRIELAMTLKELNVPSIPINFLNPIKSTPLESQPILTEEEALRIVAIYRFILPDKHIRICGGRNTVFKPKSKKRVLNCGASGLMVGDYLTTKGFNVDSDLEDINSIGLSLV